MVKNLLRFAAASALAAGLATGAPAAIVMNGSFEDGLTGWTATGPGTTPGIGITVLTTGGTNTTGYGDNVPNYDGTHAVFFVDDNANQNLSQAVSLVGGTTYSLSFALFATQSGAANPFTFTLDDLVGGTTIASANSSTVPVGLWTAYSYDFVAPTTNSYVLNFHFTSGPTPAKDVLLDAVSIDAVPEPSTWAFMLLGFAGLGFAMRRRSPHVQFA